VKHGGSQDVTRVLGRNVEGTAPTQISQGESLVEEEGRDAVHAGAQHLAGEKVGLALALHRDLAVVLEQDGGEGLCRVRHQDGPVVAALLRQVGEGPAVVQVAVPLAILCRGCRRGGAVRNSQVADDDAVDGLCQRGRVPEQAKVREAPGVGEAHVHAAVEEDVASAHAHKDAAPADVYGPWLSVLRQ